MVNYFYILFVHCIISADQNKFQKLFEQKSAYFYLIKRNEFDLIKIVLCIITYLFFPFTYLITFKKVIKIFICMYILKGEIFKVLHPHRSIMISVV